MAEPLMQSWEYLETLPGTDFYRLYQSPSSALAIFRKRLSSLAKNLVMTMLYMRRPMTSADLDLYVQPSSGSEKESALEQLRRYHIFIDATNRINAPRSYKLTPDFARSLRRALTGTSQASSFGQVIEVPAEDRVSVGDLDRFARDQWEGILGYMVGSSAVPIDGNDRTTEPSAGVVELLRAGHLIELTGASIAGHTAKITKEGFAFVLKDVNTQVWTLLFLYVANAEDLSMQNVEVLSFLFLVSSLELGLAYSTHSLTETQREMLQDLYSFGIVYLPQMPSEQQAPYFYPTRLATGLTSDASATIGSTSNANIGTSLAPSATAQGFIIIETNYRVYAYTSSTLQIALLSLFVNLRSRHPNLVTGKMTKSSIQRAVQRGITAEQIISYLTSHAHPQMRRHAAAEAAAAQARSGGTGVDVPRSVSIIPATILDQIHLWQLERDRMTTTNGFLLKEFISKREYDDVCRYADEIGVLVWKDDKKMWFFVNQIESVRRFLQDRKERNASNTASTNASATASGAVTPSASTNS